MSQDTTLHPIFARHETFHPRFGWLKKGFDKSLADSHLFSKDSASVELGVGKNMVKAIKYWCVAFKVIEEKRKDGKLYHTPTRFANKLFLKDGWDPFLENPTSLWLIHWNLFKEPCYAPAWFYAFSELNKVDFTADDLLCSLKEFVAYRFPNRKINDSTLKKDVNCVLRMYVEKLGQTKLKEDSLDCPFTELGIINAYTDSNRFTFKFGIKPYLPADIVVAACLEFAATFADEAKTISVSRLLYDSGSPGQVFKLTESTLSEAIEVVSSKTENIYLSDTAGIVQLAYDGNALALSEKILENYYRRGN